MEFSVNHPLLFLMAGILIAVVLGQSVYFLVKAMRRSKELGMDQAKVKKTIKTAAIFTIAPAVAIVISVMTLSKKLELDLQEDDFIELLAVQHEELTNEDLMELQV